MQILLHAYNIAHTPLMRGYMTIASFEVLKAFKPLVTKMDISKAAYQEMFKTNPDGLQSSFTLIDKYGRSWSIPAEVVDTNLTQHQFYLHKSIDLDSELWVVTHETTGGVVCCEKTKISAKIKSINILRNFNNEQFDLHLSSLK